MPPCPAGPGDESRPHSTWRPGPPPSCVPLSLATGATPGCILPSAQVGSGWAWGLHSAEGIRELPSGRTVCRRNLSPQHMQGAFVFFHYLLISPCLWSIEITFLVGSWYTYAAHLNSFFFALPLPPSLGSLPICKRCVYLFAVFFYFAIYLHFGYFSYKRNYVIPELVYLTYSP